MVQIHVEYCLVDGLGRNMGGSKKKTWNKYPSATRIQNLIRSGSLKAYNPTSYIPAGDTQGV